jgi:hypothetical protein
LVTGRLPDGLVDLIADRFGAAARITTAERPTFTVVSLTADQPALRALLTLLWDLGQEIEAVLRYARQGGSPGSNETGH